MRHATTVLCIVTILGVACGICAAAPATKIVPASRAVSTKIPDVSLNGATLLKALDTLAKKARVRIEVDWTALKAAGVERTSPVRTKGANLTLAQLLDLTCASVQGARHPVSWCVGGKAIRISTQAAIMGSRGRRQVISTSKSGPARAAAKPAPAPKPAAPGGVRLDFDETPAEEVVAFFGSTFKLNLVVHWNAMAMTGVDKSTPVTLKIQQAIPMGRAFDLFVDALSGDRAPLQRIYWRRSRGVIAITTGEMLDRKLSTRVMDVRDMLMGAPDFVGPSLSIQRDTTGGGSDASGGSRSGQGFSGGQSNLATGNGTATNAPPDASRAAREQSLIDIVVNSIGQEFWSPTGKGSVRIVNGKMILTQSELGFMLMNRSLNGRLR